MNMNGHISLYYFPQTNRYTFTPAGGPGQYAHLATTYAAVNALCILGTEDAFKVINRSVSFVSEDKLIGNSL